ncbi:MAG: hypothetical protein JXA28_11485 [Bacteroidetes bacterium]|nr:hypothetical protein [Bacteroidota bacterium]
MATEQQIIREILSSLEEILARIPGWTVLSTRQGVRLEAGRVDVDCTVQTPSGQSEILIEVMSDGLPGTIRRVAPRLRSYREAYSGTESLPVFAAPFVSDDGLDVCREEDIGCIDGAGNCLLPQPGAYVEIRGRKNQHPMRRPIRSLFSPKSSRIARVLLSDVARWWQVQEIAEAAGVSNGLVSRLKKRMLEEDFIMEEDRRICVRSPKRMLDAWSENYSFRRNTMGEFYALSAPAETEADIVFWCREQGIRCALGLFSAAARIAPHVRMNRSFLFVDADPEIVAKERGLKPVPSGANVVLLQPYDDGVFFGIMEEGGIPVTSPVQTYLDLISYKGRGEEAADFLLQHALEEAWEQQRTTGREK